MTTEDAIPWNTRRATMELVKLKQQKVNIIIAITHSGFSREINIVDKVTEIDVLVGGHTNTFLYTGNDHPKENKPDGPYPYVVNRTGGSQAVVVQEYWFGKFLGKLELTFDEQGKITSYGGNPILLDANVKEDVCMVSVLKPFKEKVAVQMERNIGATKVCMEHAEGVCRLQECNLGNLIADSFFHYYVNRERRESAAWSTLNGAVVNSGGIRTALPSFSNITWGDVVTTLPYGNSLVTVTLNGSLLWRMFEHSVFNYTTDKDERRGRFLQVSGFRVEYNLTQPNGCRVVSIRVLCANCSVPKYEPLQWAKTYKIVAQNFIANGGDGFKILKEANVSDVGPIEYEALEEYITKMSPIKTPNEGRIKLTWPPEDEKVVKNVTSRVRECKESLVQS
ncbi:5'-nucleotidase-like [Haemaphysalis longicornis]